MPEQDNGKERLKGQVTETHSSDSYIERQLGEIRSEIQGTGSGEPVSGDVLEPKLVDVSGTNNDAGPESKIVRIDPRNLSHDSSALAGHFRAVRVRAQRASKKKAA